MPRFLSADAAGSTAAAASGASCFLLKSSSPAEPHKTLVAPLQDRELLQRHGIRSCALSLDASGKRVPEWLEKWAALTMRCAHERSGCQTPVNPRRRRPRALSPLLLRTLSAPCPSSLSLLHSRGRSYCELERSLLPGELVQATINGLRMYTPEGAQGQATGAPPPPQFYAARMHAPPCTPTCSHSPAA